MSKPKSDPVKRAVKHMRMKRTSLKVCRLLVDIVIALKPKKRGRG